MCICVCVSVYVVTRCDIEKMSGGACRFYNRDDSVYLPVNCPSAAVRLMWLTAACHTSVSFCLPTELLENHIFRRKRGKQEKTDRLKFFAFTGIWCGVTIPSPSCPSWAWACCHVILLLPLYGSVCRLENLPSCLKYQMISYFGKAQSYTWSN